MKIIQNIQIPLTLNQTWPICRQRKTKLRHVAYGRLRIRPLYSVPRDNCCDSCIWFRDVIRGFPGNSEPPDDPVVWHTGQGATGRFFLSSRWWDDVWQRGAATLHKTVFPSIAGQQGIHRHSANGRCLSSAREPNGRDPQNLASYARITSGEQRSLIRNIIVNMNTQMSYVIKSGLISLNYIWMNGRKKIHWISGLLYRLILVKQFRWCWNPQHCDSCKTKTEATLAIHSITSISVLQSFWNIAQEPISQTVSLISFLNHKTCLMIWSKSSSIWKKIVRHLNLIIYGKVLRWPDNMSDDYEQIFRNFAKLSAMSDGFQWTLHKNFSCSNRN